MSEISELKSSIEALIAERDALFRRATLAEEWRDHNKTRAEAAESKLAENEVRLGKAVEFIEGDMLADCIETIDELYDSTIAAKMRTALAEIKGESHE